MIVWLIVILPIDLFWDEGSICYGSVCASVWTCMILPINYMILPNYVWTCMDLMKSGAALKVVWTIKTAMFNQRFPI